MKEEKLFEEMSDIDEKYIAEARNTCNGKKPIKWTKWMAVAACVCVVLGAVIVIPKLRNLSQGESDPIPGGNVQDQQQAASATDEEDTQVAYHNQIVINKPKSIAVADLDVEVHAYNKLSENIWNTVLDEFREFCGFSYEELMDRIPKGFELYDFYSLSARQVKDNELTDEYILHDYVFRFQTEGEGGVTMAICSFEEPLKDCYMECDNPKPSEINGNTLYIYGEKGNYLVQFTYDNVHYDIETIYVTEEELEAFLEGVLR